MVWSALTHQGARSVAMRAYNTRAASFNNNMAKNGGVKSFTITNLRAKRIRKAN